ncbi:sensor domain-containing diguanylate cyclase [Pseudomonas sp. M30-35]|uniref:sensor domain-containing diguanylate cyclase n=1 Tax=Pseudomonas sp. M30-35 TaxID=1981174 RepID=UPI000B3C31BA|nr:sensor domain-containing diguanylate cyclase [Pseudomonas sp. M30-35]ARU90788.1 GGDEF domain-containing protein [Pseudomonas sp. M30-35]
MLSSKLPEREMHRQAILDDQELLDTPADPYLDTIVRIVRELFSVQTVLVSLIDRDRQWFKSRIGLDVAETPRSISFCDQAIQSPEMFVVSDAHSDPRFRDNELVTGNPYVRFYAGQPLFSEEGLALGTLCLIDSQPKKLSPSEMQLFKDMATLAEGYLKLRRVSHQTEQLRAALSREQRKAMLDQLTQLWNRAGLEHFLELEHSAALDRGGYLGVLFCDLDRFKQVNDTHGHAAGDQVLWQAARRISSAVRPHDIVTRNGGEEFVVLAQVNDEHELAQIAERIRSKIGSSDFSLEQTELPLTISIGCALIGSGETGHDAMKRADRALYRAKNNGRNRVEIAEQLKPGTPS